MPRHLPLPRIPLLVLYWLAAIGVSLPFLAAAARLYRPGFPLDDAWIYQTFARTWVQAGVWGARPDQPAAGATAPLWVWLLIPGQFLGSSMTLLWTWSLGCVLLGSLAWAAHHRAQEEGLPPRTPLLLGGLMLMEWHLIWAALSGMETLAFALLAWWTLGHLQKEKPSWGLIGWLIGLGVWIRPEALLLLLAWAWRTGWLPRHRDRWRALFLTGFPLAVLVLLYLLFQLALTGQPWPNTAQAKMIEYAALRNQPLGQRWLRLAWAPLVGPALFLLPWAVKGLKSTPRTWGDVLWMAAHITLYALQLPAPYQHGRYIMPILPVVLWWGGKGLMVPTRADPNAPTSPDPRSAWKRRWRLFRNGLIALTTVTFWFLGARAYAQDVAVIESEMVATAQWIREHLPPEEPIAAHDIGALGYYAPQPLVDLAGLLNPEVIPILRDGPALARYLQARNIQYLVLFPNWYGADFTWCSAPLYRTQGPFAPRLGGENMVVYRWRPCPPGYR